MSSFAPALPLREFASPLEKLRDFVRRRGRVRRPVSYRLPSGTALPLDDIGGQLSVERGVVWLTCHDEPQDYILGPGSRVALAPGHGAVIEAVRRGEDVLVRWEPRERMRLRLAVLAGA